MNKKNSFTPSLSYGEGAQSRMDLLFLSERGGVRLLLFLVICLINIQFITASSVTVTEMRCENLINPIAIDNSMPHFSWKIQTGNSTGQQYYEIQVASQAEKLLNNEGDLWNTGRINSPSSVMIPYKGKGLTSRMLCYWRVRVWDESNNMSDWSPVQRFGIGILEDDKLQGDYIGLAAGNGDVRSPLLRKTFTLEQLHTAFLHVSSFGYHELYINGNKADDRVLAPVTSQLDKRSLIVTYDITPYLNLGQNEIVLWLGQGWYKETTFGTEYPGPLVKAEMYVWENGNRKQILTTDATWKGRESGYSDTDTWQALRFGGERMDGRIIPENLSAQVLNKLEWFPVAIVQVSDRKETPQMCEPDKIQEVLTPKSIRLLDDNTWLVDMGKVITGWFELQLPQLTAGHEVKVTYTDDYNLDPEFTDQGESDIYIASGRAGETFCNKFNHHAFRYIKIANLPEQPGHTQINAYLIHGDYRPAATFECSDADLNAIHDMIRYTLSCLTFSGYMVDCPHIERAGYGGDGNSSTQALQTMYDVSPTFLNWLQTWNDVIRPDGSLPYVAPNYITTGGGPYWCGFMILAPWRTYVNYNDSRLIERHYEAMKQWMSYVDKYTVDGLLTRWPDTDYRGWYLGDWLAPAGVDTGNELSVDLVNNCFISECLGALANIAAVLGKPEEAESFTRRKETLNQIIHRTFYNPEEGIYSTGSPLDMSYPMLVGAVPGDLYTRIKEKMMERSSIQYNGHIAVGLVGVPILTEWAIQNKEPDFLYAMLKQPDYPGYLHMINNGATTTWEYWSGERSRVHNCYNGIGNWFYEAVGGIRPDENYPGYRHLFIEPQIPEGITWAKTAKKTPYGTVAVNWELTDNKQKMDISLPAGTQASLTVPAKAIECTINSNQIPLDNQQLLLGTGSYEITFILSAK